MSTQILADLKQLLKDIANKKYNQLLEHSQPDTQLHAKFKAELTAIQQLEKEQLVFNEQHHLVYAFCLLDTIHQQYPAIKSIKSALTDARDALTNAIETNEDYQLFIEQFIGADLAKNSQDTIDAILKTAHELHNQAQPGLARN